MRDLESDLGISRGQLLDPDNRDLAPISGGPSGENVYAIQWYFPDLKDTPAFDKTERMALSRKPTRQQAKEHVARWNQIGVSEVAIRNIRKVD